MTTPQHDTASARFPGYDVLDEAPRWDGVTTGVVLRRLGPHPPIRFFSNEEEAIARPLLDRLLGQDHEPRVPVFELVDERLAEGATDGWHHDDMPDDGEAWHQSLRYVASDARGRGSSFPALEQSQQIDLLEHVRTAETWHGWRGERIWTLWMRYACTAFYSHPWAWNEIGFGGPRYPTGYKNLGLERREPWERADVGRQRP